MAEIQPFRGLRYTAKAGEIGKLTCPPYDIISEEQRKAYLAENPCNVIRLELPKEGEDPYAEAGETLRTWLSEGILKQDTEPAVYIYEEEFTAHGEKKKVKGLICRVKLEEFEKGVVLPHEETLSKAKEDRFRLMQSTFCNFSQIYSLYMDEEHETLGRIDLLSRDTPRYEFDDGAVVHRLWVVNDKAVIGQIQEDFRDRKLYIADGHHRYETALNFRNWCREQGLAQPGSDADYVMMMLVDMEHEGLVVFPTHRLIHGLDDFDSAALLSACEDLFTVEHYEGLDQIQPVLDREYAEEHAAFAFYCGGEEWDLLVLRDLSAMDYFMPELSEASRHLDVSILHTLILEKRLGIDKENMAKQVNLSYTRDFDEAIASVRSGENQCAFLLNPTRVTEIHDVAAAGEKMPQKSTYFYPKLITGLVMNRMNLGD